MMASKDYYAILMVHPKAELLVIEAAYKRLAREYHPDFKPTPHNHEKMIAINEAYEVLSDPARRSSYDEEYARQARRQQHAVKVAQAHSRHPAPPQKTTRTPNQSADPRWGNVCPTPPPPAAFGIEAGYLAQAAEGAHAWKRREHRIPNRIKWMTRVSGSLVGITLSLLLMRPPGWGKMALLAWFVLPLCGELALRVIERIRDAHLLRYKFNPLYNPNPAGYHEYAKAQATYEAETVVVYVSRDLIYHTQKTCQGMSRYEPMPKWFALFKGAKPCSRCGRFISAEPKRLPPPFGKAYFPQK
jgi:hypothetical protein